MNIDDKIDRLDDKIFKNTMLLEKLSLNVSLLLELVNSDQEYSRRRNFERDVEKRLSALENALKYINNNLKL